MEYESYRNHSQAKCKSIHIQKQAEDRIVRHILLPKLSNVLAFDNNVPHELIVSPNVASLETAA
jgi:hypothetical protein